MLRKKSELELMDDGDILPSSYNNSQEFSKLIERMAYEKDCSLIDALLEYADDNDMEPESMSLLISKSLKEKIQFEAEEACLLRKTSGRLDF